MYSKIRQPEAWASWVRQQVEKVEEGTVTGSQDLLNKGVLKFTKVNVVGNGWKASTLTIQEDIVAMLASHKQSSKKPPASKIPLKDKDKDKPPSSLLNNLPLSVITKPLPKKTVSSTSLVTPKSGKATPITFVIVLSTATSSSGTPTSRKIARPASAGWQLKVTMILLPQLPMLLKMLIFLLIPLPMILLLFLLPSSVLYPEILKPKPLLLMQSMHSRNDSSATGLML